MPASLQRPVTFNQTVENVCEILGNVSFYGLAKGWVGPDDIIVAGFECVFAERGGRIER